MTGEQCPWHADHETRIRRLENEVEEAFNDMESIKNTQRSPAVVVALIGLIGTGMATAGSIAGVVITGLFKSWGWF